MSAARPGEGERLELLARIAGLYYEDQLTQEQIASQTGYSRSMISRLLTEAREQNVVEIRVNHPLERRRDLEQVLQSRLGLKLVQVLARGTLNYEQMIRRLGGLAARLVEELVYDDITIGVSWGSAVAETIGALRPRPQSGVQVVQMIGSLGPPEPEIDGSELSRRLARIFAGRYFTLPVPLFVDSEATRQLLLSDTRVQKALQHFREIDLALMGVGTVEAERSIFLQTSYLNVEQLAELQRAGAEGDVCAIHLDLQGRRVDVPLARQIVGIDAETLQAIPMRLGVAGGQYKIRPVVAASRAGLINMLVTDEVAAGGIVQMLDGAARRARLEE